MEEKMYRVELGVVITGADGVAGLSRRLRLPFAPFLDMELGGLTAGLEDPEVVASVAWDARHRRFLIDLLGRTEPDLTLAEIIAAYGPAWRTHEADTGELIDACELPGG